MSKTLESIELWGTIAGTIWMPAIRCTKNFNVRLSPNEHMPFYRHWTGLRDALVDIISDGDFQSCKIANIGGAVKYTLCDSCFMIVPLKINPEAKDICDLFTDDFPFIDDFFED